MISALFVSWELAPLFNSGRSGGAEWRMYQIATTLATKQPNSVALLTRQFTKHEKNTILEGKYYWAEKPSFFEWLYGAPVLWEIGSGQGGFGAMARGFYWKPNIKNEEIHKRIIVYEASLHKGIRNLLWQAFRIPYILFTSDKKNVVMFGFDLTTLPLLLLTRLSGRRFIWGVSMDDHCRRKMEHYKPKYPTAIYMLLLRAVIALSNQIIAQTYSQARLLHEQHGRSADVIYNPYSPLYSFARRNPENQTGMEYRHYTYDKSHLQCERADVVWVGRNDHTKNIPLLQTLLCDTRLAHLRWRIIGLPNNLIAAADNVEVIPEVPQADIEPYIASSNVLVSTSVMEGFSNVFLQAWGNGKPVISWKCDPDGIIEGNQMGYVAHEDYETFVRQIEELQPPSPVYRWHSENCRAYIQNHAPQKIMRQWEAILS